MSRIRIFITSVTLVLSLWMSASFATQPKPAPYQEKHIMQLKKGDLNKVKSDVETEAPSTFSIAQTP